jgi:hypothetical protein
MGSSSFPSTTTIPNFRSLSLMVGEFWKRYHQNCENRKNSRSMVTQKKKNSNGKKYFKSSIFRFPRAITVILLENVIFSEIFKDSGQHFDLQLLRQCIPIKMSPCDI